jgi:hypothetical protein
MRKCEDVKIRSKLEAGSSKGSRKISSKMDGCAMDRKHEPKIKIPGLANLKTRHALSQQ